MERFIPELSIKISRILENEISDNTYNLTSFVYIFLFFRYRLKSDNIYILFILFIAFKTVFPQDTITYTWPDEPFESSKIINGTFCEFRNTGSADHFHNAVDIGEPDGNPVYACLNGTVYSIVHDASNSYVSVISNVNGGWKRLTYLHIVPNPALSVGQSVTVRQSIMGTIYSGMGHVHLIEREIVSNPDNSAAEINNIRAGGGLTPYTDPESPIIYENSVKFFNDNSSEVQSPDALHGKVDIKLKVVDRNGSTSSGSNNGTYILGYKLWNKDTSEVVYSLNGDGTVYRFDRKPLDNQVHSVFVANEATLSNPVYWLTNGEGADAINSTRNVGNNYLDTDLFGEGEYVIEIFAEDTRSNKVNTFIPVRFTTPPSTPVLKAVLNTDKKQSVRVIWENNIEEDLAGYRLYYSVNTQLNTWSLAADETLLTTGIDSYNFNSPAEFINPPTSDIYFFRLTAVDSSGAESQPSDIYSRAPHRNGTNYPTVLIVDGFDQYEGIGSYGYPTHAFNTYYFVPLFISDSLVISSAADDAILAADVLLNDYDFVVWFTGDDGGPVKALTTPEQLLLQNYLNNGGNLLISGSDESKSSS